MWKRTNRGTGHIGATRHNSEYSAHVPSVSSYCPRPHQRQEAVLLLHGAGGTWPPHIPGRFAVIKQKHKVYVMHELKELANTVRGNKQSVFLCFTISLYRTLPNVALQIRNIPTSNVAALQTALPGLVPLTTFRNAQT